MSPETNPPQGELYSVAVVIDEAEMFPEMLRGLSPAFRAMLANTEQLIKEAVEDRTLHAMLFDLDSIGDGARDGVDVLQEIRAIRDDIVLVAMTRSRDHSIPLRASQAGADEFVLAPVNYEELQSVLARAIEKRAHELEGRRVVQQAESRSAFCSLIGASSAMQTPLSDDSGSRGQQYYRRLARRKRHRQGTDCQSHRAVERARRSALYLPELLGVAGLPDRVGTFRLRKGRVYRGRRLARGTD